MRSSNCVVEVGSHPGPFYIRLSDGQQFCSRHYAMMIEEDPVGGRKLYKRVEAWNA